MRLIRSWTVAAFILIMNLQHVIAEQQCTSEGYVNCVKMADPLLTEPNLIFPDKLVDIDDLCRRWRQFVQCVKTYTARCFTETQQQDFIKAVESPVDLVHQMCTESQYQLEYLKHAPCIQSTITRDGLCTRNYRQLVDQVLGDVDQNNLCCSHHHFHECVLSEVRRRCSIAENGDSATKFTREILDKSLSFLQARCNDYDHKSRECSQRMLPTNTHNGVMNQNDSSSNMDNNHHNDMPTQQQRSTMASQHHQPQLQDKEIPPFWLSGQNVDHNRNSNPIRPQYPSSADPPDVNSRDSHFRFRNSSYGRGINWPASSPQTSSAQTQTHDLENPSIYNTWRVSSNSATSTYTTEAWYPSILNNRGKMNNAVDEPNQQGLAHNIAAVSHIRYNILTIIIIVVVIGMAE